MMRDEDVGLAPVVEGTAWSARSPTATSRSASSPRAEHRVRRLPVVEEDGRVVGVVAQADVARLADDRKTGEVVERISQH